MHRPIEIAIPIDDHGKANCPERSGRATDSPSDRSQARACRGRGGSPRPTSGSFEGTSSPPVRASSRSVFPPMCEAMQGRPVAIASRSELLIPSATLGRTKRSAARRWAAGRRPPPDRTRSEGASRLASTRASSRSRSGPSPSRIRWASVDSWTDLGPGIEQHIEILLWVQSSGEEYPRPGEATRRAIGLAREITGERVDAARHPMHPIRRDAQGEPLSLDVESRWQRRRVPEDRRRRAGKPLVRASSSASP